MNNETTYSVNVSFRDENGDAPCTTSPRGPKAVLLGCGHEHHTIASAAACISKPGYVVAIENGRLRALNDAEEAEFQRAVHGGVTEGVKGISVTVSVNWSVKWS
jgi:hypothetical protein